MSEIDDEILLAVYHRSYCYRKIHPRGNYARKWCALGNKKGGLGEHAEIGDFT